MSLPNFPDKPEGYSIEDSLSQILTSIAMEELGLSHILNAEGEKIQYILGTLDHMNTPNHYSTVDEILEINESVKEMLDAIATNQMFLYAKMTSALNAYNKFQKDSDNKDENDIEDPKDPNDPEDPDDPEDPEEPNDHNTEPVGGLILEGSLIGDTSDWIEIARNEEFSLIVRQDFLNTYNSPAHVGEPSWQFTPFGPNNNYTDGGNHVKKYINNWFRGEAGGSADNLDPDAPLRDYTVGNNALQVLGTGAMDGSNLTGISSPTGIASPMNYDTAFPLSYGEAAQFISTKFSWNGKLNNEESSLIAQDNFTKINIPSLSLNRPYYSAMWLRSPGDSSQKAANLYYNGEVFQEYINGENQEYGLIYPALWVHQDIFDL